MRGNFRWIALASLALNLLLLQALDHQAGQLTTMRSEIAGFRDTIARIEAENEAARVELAVLNVLDSHRLRVSPARRKAIAETILQVSRRYELPPELILGVIFTESSFDIDAESEVGAVGLMQLMPATASQLAAELELEWKGRQLLTDPEVNILLGSFYLRKLIHRFDDLDAALAAYNMGPNRLRWVLRTHGRLPRSYAERVHRVAADLRERFF